MRPLPFALGLGLALLLAVGAGAGDAQPAGSTRELGSDPGEATGRWVVTDSFGQAAPDQPSPVGRRLALTAAGAEDLAGRSCPNPLYRREELGEAAFLGLAPGAPAGLGRAVPVLEVSCAGQPFGRYAYWKEGSLLAAEGGRVYRLAKEEETASPPAVPETSAAPPSALPAVAPPAAVPAADLLPAALAGEGARLYLASYRDEAGAARGWRQLAGQAPLLARLQPVQRPVSLPGKGRFIRLYAEGADAAQATEICRSLARLLPDCGAKRAD